MLRNVWYRSRLTEVPQPATNIRVLAEPGAKGPPGRLCQVAGLMCTTRLFVLMCSGHRLASPKDLVDRSPDNFVRRWFVVGVNRLYVGDPTEVGGHAPSRAA